MKKFTKIFITILLLLLLAGSISAIYYGIKYTELSEQTQQEQNDNSGLFATIENLRTEINGLNTQKVELGAQIENLKAQEEYSKALIEELENKVADYEQQITDLKNQVRYLEELLEEYEVTTKLSAKFYVKDELYDVQLVEAGEYVDETKIIAPTLTGYQFNYWTLDGENEVDFSTLVINKDTSLYAKFTALEQSITLGFISSDYIGYENAGTFIKTTTGTGTGTLQNGNAPAKLNFVYSGKSVVIDIYLNPAFSFSGNVVTYTTDSGSLSTNKYSFSAIEVCDINEIGYSYHTQLTISDINSSDEINIYVKPVYYNIAIVHSSSYKTLTTIENVAVYGRTFDLLSLLTTEEIDALRSYKTESGAGFNGLYTSAGNTGTKYFDYQLTMLSPWFESGYEFNNSEYTYSSNYDPDTNTITLYAGYAK